MSTENKIKNFRESKEWITMNTVLDLETKEKSIVSNISTKNNLNEEYKVIYNEIFDSKKITEFIRKNNKNISNNIFLISNEFLNIIYKKSCFCICNIMKNNEIKSFCISLILPIKVEKIQRDMIKYTDISLDNFHPNKKTVLFGYTNYLCTDLESRNTGIGINAVKATLEYGFDKGVQFGYFVSPVQKTVSSLALIPWFRIINHKNATRVGYSIPEANDWSETKINLTFSNKIPLKYRIEQSSIDDYRHYNKFTILKKFVYTPSKDHWLLYINSFLTYNVYFEKELVGMFSIKKSEIFISKSEKIANVSNLLWILGNEEHIETILKCVCNIAEALKTDILYGYVIGDLNVDNVKEINGSFTRQMFFEFYNTHIKYELKDITVPLY
jgi:hypothetical protein